MANGIEQRKPTQRRISLRRVAYLLGIGVPGMIATVACSNSMAASIRPSDKKEPTPTDIPDLPTPNPNAVATMVNEYKTKPSLPTTTSVFRRSRDQVVTVTPISSPAKQDFESAGTFDTSQRFSPNNQNRFVSTSQPARLPITPEKTQHIELQTQVFNNNGELIVEKDIFDRFLQEQAEKYVKNSIAQKRIPIEANSPDEKALINELSRGRFVDEKTYFKGPVNSTILFVDESTYLKAIMPPPLVEQLFEPTLAVDRKSGKILINTQSGIFRDSIASIPELSEAKFRGQADILEELLKLGYIVISNPVIRKIRAKG